MVGQNSEGERRIQGTKPKGLESRGTEGNLEADRNNRLEAI